MNRSFIDKVLDFATETDFGFFLIMGVITVGVIIIGFKIVNPMIMSSAEAYQNEQMQNTTRVVLEYNLVRLYDKDAGVVCYVYNIQSVYCLPIEQTQLTSDDFTKVENED